MNLNFKPSNLGAIFQPLPGESTTMAVKLRCSELEHDNSVSLVSENLMWVLDFILQRQLKRLFEKKAKDDFKPHVSSKHFTSPFAISLFISVKKDLSMRFGEVGDEIGEVQQRSARSSTEGQGNVANTLGHEVPTESYTDSNCLAPLEGFVIEKSSQKSLTVSNV